MPLLSPITEYMTPDPVTVKASDPLSDAAILMDSMHLRHLPVEREGAIVGVLTIESIVSEILRVNDLPKATSVGEARASPAVWLDPSARVADAVRLMVSTGVDAVLVGSQGSLRGIVTSRDVIRALVGEDLGEPASRLMDEGSLSSPPTATVREALEQMLWSGRRHVIVTNPDGVVLGVFSVRDGLSLVVTLGSEALKRSLSSTITGHVYAVDPGAPWFEVVQAMAERDIGALPVVTAGRLLGVVTEWGLVRLAASRVGGGRTP